MPASVDSEDLSGEIGRGLDQLEDKLSYLLGLSQTVRGDLFPESVHFLRGEAMIHGSVNDPAGNGVDLDIAGRQLFSESFGEAVHAALGSGIGDFHGSSDVSPDGRNIDDTSAVLLQHQRNRQTAGIETGTEIRIYDTLPFFDTHIREQTDVGDSGIIDQNIQMIQGSKYFFNRRGIRGIRRQSGAVDAVFFFQRDSEAGQLRESAATGQDKVVTGSGEGLCDGTSDTSGSTGDKSKRCVLYCIHVKYPF